MVRIALLCTALVWPVLAEAQVVKGAVAPHYLPPPTIVPLLPSPMVVSIHLSPQLAAPPAPTINSTGVVLSPTGTPVTELPIDQNAIIPSEGETHNAASDKPMVTVSIEPPPPKKADELPDAECKYDDDNNAMTASVDCGFTHSLAGSESSSWFNWWVVAIAAALAVLVVARIARRR